MASFIPVKTRALAREAARKYLQTHTKLTGGNLYQLPDGSKIRVRKKEGGRLSSESYDTKSKADNLRNKRESQFRTDEEYQNYQQVKTDARRQSDSTLVRHATANKKFNLEHEHRLASGGTNETVSTSDPFFAEWKTSAENKIFSKYGDKYVVDVNDITGYLRVIPKQSHNIYQHRSKQPGFDLEPDMDLDSFVDSLATRNIQSPGLQSLIEAGQLAPARISNIPGINVNPLATTSSRLPQGLSNLLDIINSDENILTKSMQVAEEVGPTAVSMAASVFNGVNEYVADNNGGEDIFDAIPNGTADERKEKNGKINGDHVKNNGHNGNGNGHAITNQIDYIAKKLSNGQLPYNGD
tara:strand:- start:2066 stop:3127 length:1062 start_codon:yes stop_codon:yes gene_type:complete